MYSCVVYVTNRTKSPTCRKTVHRKTHGAVEQDIHWFGFRTNTSQKILVQVQSLALETPTVEFLANEQKRLACAQALGVFWWWGGKRQESLQLHLWNLHSTSNSPVARRRLTWPDPGSGNDCNVNKHWKTCAKVNDVITNVISTNLHFASTFLMQQFKFQRHNCKLYFLFLPRCQSTLRACSQSPSYSKISYIWGREGRAKEFKVI